MTYYNDLENYMVMDGDYLGSGEKYKHFGYYEEEAEQAEEELYTLYINGDDLDYNEKLEIVLSWAREILTTDEIDPGDIVTVMDIRGNSYFQDIKK